ncbi:PIN domain-containing protein [Roseateles sp. DC23W]|uniref:PIN domain-containing protein n=1 Tax=Pelomonas dachongensis TaxID=3299029 RepID=A0ABW7EKW7_9BURK
MNPSDTQLQALSAHDAKRAAQQKERIAQVLIDHGHLGVAADANVYGRRTSLRQAPFNQLEAVLQKNPKLQMLLPEVWRREISRNVCRQLVAELGNKRAQLDKAKGIKDEVVLEALKDAYERNQSERDAAGALAERITSEHFEACNVTNLPVVTDCSRLVHMYFEALPPFDPDGKKPNEYRDAISLLDLEAHAEEKNMDVVVVTNDDGCLRFCDGTRRLIGVQRLEDLFAALQSHNDLLAMHALEARLNEQLKGGADRLLNVLMARLHFRMTQYDLSPLAQLARESQKEARNSFQNWYVEILGEPSLQPFSDGRVLRMSSAYADDVSIEVQMLVKLKIFAAGHYIKTGETEFHPDHRESVGEVTLGVEAAVCIPQGDVARIEEQGEIPGNLISLKVASGEIPQLVPPDPELFRFFSVA